MLLIDAVDIKKFYGDRLILKFDEFKIRTGDKIGIIGLNGAGKTTLLQILSGNIEPDEGFVKRYCDIAYIQQFGNEQIRAECKLLKELSVDKKVDSNNISGGERMRLKIADALSHSSSILIADEPTSNLDLHGIEYLKKKFMQIETLLLISHDSDLLNCLCSKIVEIKDGSLNFYNGNYTSYQEQCRSKIELEKKEYEEYTNEKERLEKSAAEKLKKAKKICSKPHNISGKICLDSPGARSKGSSQKNMQRAAKAIQSRIEHLEVKEKPKNQQQIKIDFTLTNPPENKIVISCENMSFSYGSNMIFKSAGFRVKNKKKTALIGKNGSGKTTLLNLITNGYDKIYKVPNAVLGYFYQNFENLNMSKSVIDNIMGDSIQNESVVRTILARLLIKGDDIYKKADVLSGGEKIKLSFAKLLVSSANILLLDEPTNYLDLPSIEVLKEMLMEYEGTVLFISHDRAFVNTVADRLLIIKNNAITEFEGNLDEYERNIENLNADQSNETQKMILKLRMVDIISKMSYKNADKDKLEIEYDQILSQLRML